MDMMSAAVMSGWQGTVQGRPDTPDTPPSSSEIVRSGKGEGE